MTHKMILVGFNPIVVTSIEGDLPRAVSPDGKKFKIVDTDEHEGCSLDWWEDEDGYKYFELGLIG